MTESNNLVELGYFGNIWVRQNTLLKTGDSFAGHKHKFDHVTLLAQGAVTVEVEGRSPKKFVGPTFIVIRKELNHKITALQDNTIYYCVFALRDIDGEIVEDIYGNKHDPSCSESVADDYWTKVEKISDI